MGCDIHAHLEVKIAGEWHHYNTCPCHSRIYKLFAKMAGVRNFVDDSVVPIAQPRGLPEDVATITQLDFDGQDGDAHTPSWLGIEELVELRVWGEKELQSTQWSWRMSEDFGRLFGYYIHDFLDYRKDYPKELEDVRLVFWFDN